MEEKFKRTFIVKLKTNDVYAIRNADAKIRDWFDWGKFAKCNVGLKEIK